MSKKLLYLSIGLNIIFGIGFLYLVHTLGGWTFLQYRMNNRGLAPEYEHRKSLFEHMPLAKNNIVFLGNSLTAQCDWAEMLNNPTIRNRGIPGETTDGLLRRLESILQSHPRQLFLMIGVNDLLFHAPNRVIENYKLIVDQIVKQSPDTELYLYSILPVNGTIRNIPISNEDIRLINQSIKALALEKGLNYIDLHSRFSNDSGLLFEKYTSDGVHLNGDGYLLWKSEIEGIVK